MSKEFFSQTHKRHGPEVEINERSIGENQVLSQQIKDVGKVLTPFGLEYSGSLVVHIYTQPDVGLQARVSFASHVCEARPFSAGVARTALETLGLQTMRHFGQAKPSTRDKSDKRGKMPGDSFKE